MDEDGLRKYWCWLRGIFKVTRKRSGGCIPALIDNGLPTRGTYRQRLEAGQAATTDRGRGWTVRSRTQSSGSGREWIQARGNHPVLPRVYTYIHSRGVEWQGCSWKEEGSSNSGRKTENTCLRCLNIPSPFPETFIIHTRNTGHYASCINPLLSLVRSEDVGKRKKKEREIKQKQAKQTQVLVTSTIQRSPLPAVDVRVPGSALPRPLPQTIH